MRRRSAILEALEVFRDLHPGVTLGQMIAFLYVCENEGVTLLDLSHLTGFYLATASRTIRAFAEPCAPDVMTPGLGLVDIAAGTRGKQVRLTAKGRAFRDALSEIIAEAAPMAAAAVEHGRVVEFSRRVDLRP